MAKFNMSPNKNPIPTRDAAVRAHDFFEVATGYDESTAIDEALRCLSCKNMPCSEGCPVNIRIPEFISKIKEGDFGLANVASTITTLFGIEKNDTWLDSIVEIKK